MTTFFMISDYGFAILKVFIFFILLHAVYPTFKYRYAVIISCIAAPFYIQINELSALYDAFRFAVHPDSFYRRMHFSSQEVFCFNFSIRLLCADGGMY